VEKCIDVNRIIIFTLVIKGSTIGSPLLFDGVQKRMSWLDTTKNSPVLINGTSLPLLLSVHDGKSGCNGATERRVGGHPATTSNAVKWLGK
jgi:hypothetical protein